MNNINSHLSSNRSYDNPQQRAMRLARLYWLARSIMNELNRREAAGAQIDLASSKSEWDEVKSLILRHCYNRPRMIQ